MSEGMKQSTGSGIHRVRLAAVQLPYRSDDSALSVRRLAFLKSFGVGGREARCVDFSRHGATTFSGELKVD